MDRLVYASSTDRVHGSFTTFMPLVEIVPYLQFRIGENSEAPGMVIFFDGM